MLCFGSFAETLLDPLVVFERAQYVKEKLPDVRLIVNSNGGPALVELAEALKPFVDGYTFHVEALTPAIYEDLMRPLKADRVFPRIEEFIRWSDPPVAIACPVSVKNLPELGALRDYWMALGAVQFVLRRFRAGVPTTCGTANCPSPPQGRCAEDITSDLIVDADGTVLTCCNDFLRVEPVGDLTRETVPELIVNAARKNVYEKFAEDRLDEFASWWQLPDRQHGPVERTAAVLNADFGRKRFGKA